MFSPKSILPSLSVPGFSSLFLFTSALKHRKLLILFVTLSKAKSPLRRRMMDAMFINLQNFKIVSNRAAYKTLFTQKKKFPAACFTASTKLVIAPLSLEISNPPGKKACYGPQN
jgi:hypothetical protein